MPSFHELQRIAARADRAMAALSAAQRREINTRLTLTLRVILREAQGLYARAMQELDEIGEVASGTAYRLARARLLLDQLDGTLQAAARDTQPLNGLLQNARQAADLAREIANQAIDRYGVQSLTISTPLDHRQLVSLVENAAVRLHRHTLDNIERIKDSVTTGLVRGSGWPRVSRDIRESTGLLRSRADMIAITELHNAAADSRAATYLERGVEYVIRIVTIDDRTCPVCGARSGEITRLADTREVLHPRCLPGGMQISASGVEGHSRRWYEGEIVTVATRQGNRLTMTPNHPVLTPGGWVAAGRLHVGSHVISGSGSDRMLSRLLHDQHVQGSIEQVTNARAQAPEVTTRPVPVTAEHFHGDGVGSEIAHVGADRKLWDGHDASLQQQVMQVAFMVAVEAALRHARARGGHLGAHGHGAPSTCSVCGPHLPGALLRRHRSPLDPFGFAVPPERHPGVTQAQLHHVTADAESARQAIDTLAGHVAPDEIVHIERDTFRGHVYNLQTKAGWYVAEGIVTHNCRCILNPWYPQWVEDGVFDPEEVEREAQAILRELEEQGLKPRYGRAPFEPEDYERRVVWRPGMPLSSLPGYAGATP